MVATTTSMHSVTGMYSLITCEAPYFSSSSSSSSSSSTTSASERRRRPGPDGAGGGGGGAAAAPSASAAPERRLRRAGSPPPPPTATAVSIRQVDSVAESPELSDIRWCRTLPPVTCIRATIQHCQASMVLVHCYHQWRSQNRQRRGPWVRRAPLKVRGAQSPGTISAADTQFCVLSRVTRALLGLWIFHRLLGRRGEFERPHDLGSSSSLKGKSQLYSTRGVHK